MDKIEEDLVDMIDNLTAERFANQDLDAFDPSSIIQMLDIKISEVDAEISQAVAEEERLFENMENEQKDFRSSVGLAEKKVESFFSELDSLDSRYNSVGSTAVRIGDRLEMMDRQLSRVELGQTLMEYFDKFNEVSLHNDGSGHSTVFRNRMLLSADNDSSLHRNAELVNQLLLVSKDLQSDKATIAIQNIEKRSAEIEEKLLAQFRAAHKMFDEETMKRTAKTLNLFNKGANLTNQYVFFCLQDLTSSSQLSRQIQELCVNIDEFGSFLNCVIVLFRREFHTISTIFPNPVQVTEQLIVRIFLDPTNGISAVINSLTPSLESLTQRLNQDHFKALQTLQIVYVQMKEFIQQLYTLLSSPHVRVNANHDHPDPPIQISLSFLREQLNAVFHEYRKQYCDCEIVSLERQFVSTSQSIIDYLHASPVTLLQGTHLSDVISELCSIGLSQSVITNIIVQSRLAISRCQTVASEDQIINGVQGIASTFLNHVTEILNSVLTRAYQWLRDSSTCATAGALSGSAANTKSEAIQAIHFFTIVQATYPYIREANEHISEIKPLLQSNPNILTSCMNEKRRLFSSIEGLILQGIGLIMDAIKLAIEHILSELQVKTDYKPKTEDQILTEPTSACQEVIRFLEICCNAINSTLDGNNLNIFLYNLAHETRQIILAHIRCFKVNEHGSLVLASDVKQFCQFFKKFNNPRIDKLFEMLREIVNLYILSPNNLNEFIQDSSLASMPGEQLLEYVRMRDDYKSRGVKASWAKSLEEAIRSRSLVAAVSAAKSTSVTSRQRQRKPE